MRGSNLANFAEFNYAILVLILAFFIQYSGDFQKIYGLSTKNEISWNLISRIGPKTAKISSAKISSAKISSLEVIKQVVS